MRMRSVKRTPKGVKMKEGAKKKARDSVAETISLVIKGKFKPKKAAVEKKTLRAITQEAKKELLSVRAAKKPAAVTKERVVKRRKCKAEPKLPVRKTKKAKVQAPMGKVQVPTGKAQVPTGKVQSWTVKAQAPTVKVQASTVKAQPPTVKVQAPAVKVQAPAVKAQPPPLKVAPPKKKPVPGKAKVEAPPPKLVPKAKPAAKPEKLRKLKLYSMWSGPKRHRVASLNALAKVHCLYENESRSNLLDQLDVKKEVVVVKTEPESPPPSTRILRSVPGLRVAGKMWDMHDTTSSSSDDESEPEFVPVKPKLEVVKPKLEKVDEVKVKEEKKPPKRRKRTEIIMDLKDMVVRKRMASLNATAILAASLSVEKRHGVSVHSDSDTDSLDSEDSYAGGKAIDSKLAKAIVEKKGFEEDVAKDEKVLEVRATPNKKVSVILNQDTDVTITGVYVNSTTRSTHHEGYCSIAGMQYRISATSHTQTAATAVSTETILQSASASSSQENSNGETPPSKSYTPLDALSNMQPPADSGGTPVSVPMPHHHLQPPQQHGLPHTEVSPLSRRHGCTSAFTAPPGGGPQTLHVPTEHNCIQGYYQPAGPLISVSHGHSQQPPGKTVPPPDPSPSVTPPTHQQPPPPPSSAGDSSDSEVIITSVTSTKEASASTQQTAQPPTQQYRFSHYPPSHSTYPYGYPPQYYAPPPPPPAPAYPHHEICYPPYSQHKYMYRRYLPPPPPAPQYYQPNSPDLYNQPQHAQNTSQQVVTATSTASGSGYPPTQASGPPPPTLIETYPPPPPPLVETYGPPPYYAGYGPAPPACYTHSSPSRSLNYIKSVMPLPPVALALPLEPASATGPPSPARGSAGMPPPPSPAGAVYQPQPPAPPKQEAPEPPDLKHAEKRRKARVGKAMVRNNQNTMLLMCQAQNTAPPLLENVKREVESPKETEKVVVVAAAVEQEKLPEPVKTEPELPPCVKTVAENVKVKNMKRKLAVGDETTPPPTKSPKLDGSYKDLIKKTQSVFRINNGKRKLISGGERRFVKVRRRARFARRSRLLAARRNVVHVELKAPSIASERTTKTESTTKKKEKRTAVTTTKAKSKAVAAPETAKKKGKEAAQAVPKVPRRSVQLRWSNGWTWEGEPFEGKVFLNSDEAIVTRKCYPAMRHEEGDLIEPRDCVLLKAGQRKNELPFVAKIASLWENPEDGEMMMSLLWYYRPEHTEQGRLISDQADEVFASRHKDSNSVACIEDKCYVLTFNEYCRYRKNLRRLEEGIEDTGPCIPLPEPYPRLHWQPPTSVFTSPDMVFFCRRVYDFRQKRIVKNPS